MITLPSSKDSWQRCLSLEYFLSVGNCKIEDGKLVEE